MGVASRVYAGFSLQLISHTNHQISDIPGHGVVKVEHSVLLEQH